MTLRVENWNIEKDGKLTELSMRKKLENMGYRVTRYIYPPGTCFPDHSHDENKIDAVLSGQFMMKVGKNSIMLKSGDALEVPKGTMHSAEVVGDEPVVSLDAVEY